MAEGNEDTTIEDMAAMVDMADMDINNLKNKNLYRFRMQEISKVFL